MASSFGACTAESVSVPLTETEMMGMKTVGGNESQPLVCVSGTTQCPSTDEWINKMKYIHMMKYYSTMKRNDVLSDACYNVAKP